MERKQSRGESERPVWPEWEGGLDGALALGSPTNYGGPDGTKRQGKGEFSLFPRDIHHHPWASTLHAPALQTPGFMPAPWTVPPPTPSPWPSGLGLGV